MKSIENNERNMKSVSQYNGISRGYMVVINESGERKQIKVKDYNRMKGTENEVGLCDYKYDLKWDLSHGFTEACKAFDDIENGLI